LSDRKASIGFQSSEQDLISLLGPPNQLFYKHEDKMKIYTSSYTGGLGCFDVFYNYFDLGMDFLFDTQSHQLRKIILHTNLPGYFDFTLYSKCNFQINDSNANPLSIGPDTKV